MSAANLTLYGLIGSQPVKTASMFLRLNNIPYTTQPINPYSGETKTPEYLAMFPASTIPALKHNDFALSESFAICIYIAELYKVSNQWWPTDLQKRAKIHEYLHWHHGNTRNCSFYFFYAFLNMTLLKGKPNPAKLEELRPAVEGAFKYIEGRLEHAKGVAGTAEHSLADLACYNELSYMRMTEWDFSKYPKISSWLQEIDTIGPVQSVNKEVEDLMKTLA